MRKFLPVAVSAVLMSTTAALSADELADVPFTWSGAYIGVTAGITATRADTKMTRVNGDLLTLDVDNGLFLPLMEEDDADTLVGLRGGIDAQAGRLTFGARIALEKLGNGSSVGHSKLDPNCASPVFCNLDTRSRATTDMDAVMSAEALLGVAFGRARVYGTGGFAVSKITNSFALDLIPTQAGNLEYSNNFQERDWRYGYTVGVGAEYALTDRITTSLEYSYYDFENVTVRASDPPNFGDNLIEYEFSNRGHAAAIGLNVRF